MTKIYRVHVHDQNDQGRWLAQADFRKRPSRDEIPPSIPLLYEPGRYEIRVNVVQGGEEYGLAGWLQDAAPVRVIFRQWRCSSRYDGGIIALFPDLAEANPPNGMCSSFEHVGQHGAADLAWRHEPNPSRAPGRVRGAAARAGGRAVLLQAGRHPAHPA